MMRSLPFRPLYMATILLLLFSGQASLAATPPDTMEQRLASCTSCHGKYGAGVPDNPRIPALAGKPSAYLYQQLLSFQSGRRSFPPMEHVIRYLSPEYLREIAEYYSQQPPPMYARTAPSLPSRVLERGKQLATQGDPARSVPSCQQCHGKRLTGVLPLMPGLAGLTYDYILAQLKQWRAQGRGSADSLCMGVVANRMRKSDLKAVSAWIADQPLPDDMAPVASRDQAQPLPEWCVLGMTGDAS